MVGEPVELHDEAVADQIGWIRAGAGERFAERRHLLRVDALAVDGRPDLDDRSLGDVGQMSVVRDVDRHDPPR